MKKRLDILLSESELFPSREKAKAAIMAGIVWVDGQRCDKPGTPVDASAHIDIRGMDCPYVSRGGLKLEKAIRSFHIDVQGAYCMDIGASTGGFTDCLLQHGADGVYAVDVGYGQLAYKLRTHPKVVVIERTNVRHVDPDRMPMRFDFIAIDVSFISLKLVLPVAAAMLERSGSLVCLVKPQFEAGRRDVGKKGIVRDARIHRQTISSCVDYARNEGLAFSGVTHSPVTGARGNIEFLLHVHPADAGADVHSPDVTAAIQRAVLEAHEALEPQ